MKDENPRSVTPLVPASWAEVLRDRELTLAGHRAKTGDVVEDVAFPKHRELLGVVLLPPDLANRHMLP